MLKTCANSWCKQAFEVTDEDLQLYEKVSPVFGGKKYGIPPPTLCPECRQQRRLSHANRYRLFRRKSSLTGNSIISIYPPEAHFPVYEAEHWWSDAWDPLAFGREISFQESALPQLHALSEEVPLMSLYNDANENCPYVNWTGWAKNCYMCYGVDYSEDCHYSEGVYYSRDSTDCLHGQNLERSYECTDCRDSYDLQFSQNCSNCSDSAFLFDCIACKHCFGCTGLRQKEYYYFNTPLSREDYEKRMQEHYPLLHSTILSLQEQLQELALRHPRKCSIGLQNEHSTGDYLYHCRNARLCFDCDDLEDCSYCTNMRGAKDCQDLNFWGHPGELCYETIATGEGARMIAFCNAVWGNTENMYYCNLCIYSRNCFGCSGLKRKEYCILNRQYSKEEYERLVPQIIEHMQSTGEWGEFFPVVSSLFFYNDSLASHFFPLAKEEVLKRGWRWRDSHDESPSVTKVISGKDVPERIDAIPDDILEWAIKCSMTGRPFRIIGPELKFYRTHKLPVPLLHPDERHRQRWKLRNPRKIWKRECGKCQKIIETSYAPERPEIVYCEECYLAAVY